MEFEPDLGPEGPEVEGEISHEAGEILLEELRELVDDVEPGAAGEDEELRDRLERLVSSLYALPIPPRLRDEPIEILGTWARVLAVEGGHERQGGPEQIRALVHDELAELRDLLSRSSEGELD